MVAGLSRLTAANQQSSIEGVDDGRVQAVREMEPGGELLVIDPARVRDGSGPVVNRASDVIGMLAGEAPASARSSLVIPINYVRALLASQQIR